MPIFWLASKILIIMDAIASATKYILKWFLRKIIKGPSTVVKTQNRAKSVECFFLELFSQFGSKITITRFCPVLGFNYSRGALDYCNNLQCTHIRYILYSENFSDSWPVFFFGRKFYLRKKKTDLFEDIFI